MNSIYKIGLLVLLAASVFSCEDDNKVVYTPPRDRTEVYLENIDEIEEYLKNNYLVINGDEVEVKAIDGGTQTSIWDQYKDAVTEELPSITVKNDLRTSVFTDGLFADPVDYKMYYIVLNQGNGQAPTPVDSVYVGYKGWNLSNEVFDQNNSGSWFSYPDVNTSISGFRQILSNIGVGTGGLKTHDGAGVVGANGSVSYPDAGNVIVFIPSGLAYFSGSVVGIEQYAPIAFNIKLFRLKERDHDYDRILTKYEDLNGDGNYFNDDTDGNTIPDFLDLDDDGDGLITKFEIRYESSPGVYDYYDFNSIPLCPSNGIKRHLDKECN